LESSPKPDPSNLNNAIESPQIFSIGHSNHEMTVFVALLKQHRIDSIFDVRSHPYSKYSSHFNMRSLRSALENERIKYAYLGAELGGQPEEKSFYDRDGHVLYDRIAQSEAFRNALDRVVREMQNSRSALLCSEEDPSECHRHLLIGRVLRERGINLNHIRADGALQTEQELFDLQKSRKQDLRQLDLFPQTREPSQWKSIRSVLPKNQRFLNPIEK